MDNEYGKTTEDRMSENQESTVQPVMTEVQAQPVMTEAQAQPVMTEVQGQPVMSEVQEQPMMSEVQEQPVMTEAQAQPIMPDVQPQPWQPGTGTAFAENHSSVKKKKKKEKKPITMGKVVRTCVAFSMITVLLNTSVVYLALRYNVGNYVKSSDYKRATSIQSTQSNINETLKNSSDAVTTDTSTAKDGTLSVADVASAVLPAVVSITSTSVYESYSNPFWFGSDTYEVSGAGSGIIIGTNDTELLIATNNHVVEDTTSLTLEFVDGSTVDSAYIKGTNASNDIAVVAVKLEEIEDNTLKEIRTATLGDSDALVVGEQVVAIGNALGYGQSVTVGYVSALNRTTTVESHEIKAIQTDASINGGNSGGALINMKGEVVGINFAKQSSSSSSQASIEGMGYAIPISSAKDILDDLSTKEMKEEVAEEDRGYMGITQAISTDEEVQEMYNIPIGAYIKGIVEGSPIEKAGVQIGDVIVAIDGDDVDSYDEVQEKMAYYAAGETVKITVARPNGHDHEELEFEIKLCTYEELEKMLK